MKIIGEKQCQFELFPSDNRQPDKKNEQRFLLTKLTLPIENVIVLGVIIIMSMVISFSIGVEKGKRNISSIRKVKPEKSVKIEEKKPIIQEKIVVENAGLTIAPLNNNIINKEEKKPHIKPAIDITETEKKKKVDKIYTIQVASFKKEKYAQKEAMDLKKEGYEIFVLPKGNYSIVCVGKFAQKREAKIFSRKLKNKYKDCILRSL